MGDAASDRRLHGTTDRAVKGRYLPPAVAATLIAAAALTGAVVYARQLERRYVHTLGSTNFPQKTLGIALQAEAFRQPDLLPIYGSSEILRHTQYHAGRVFRYYPTGFTVFPVAMAGASPLMFVARIAAIGSTIRGRKIVISVVPSNLYQSRRSDVYAGNFSRLQATALAFSLDLPFRLKRSAARRLLDYPETLERDPLLRMALQLLADGSAKSRAFYGLLFPLGKLQELVLAIQDHWENLTLDAKILTQENRQTKVFREFDWQSLAAQAEGISEQHASNNPFGFDNRVWTRYSRQLMRPRGGEGKTVQSVRRMLSSLASHPGLNWADLDLLLDELNALGAEPLIMAAPFKGPYLDYWGVSPQSRQVYFETLRAMGARHGVPVVDFADHDQDRYFVVDTLSHISEKAWVYYDRVLDDFYHSRLSTAGTAVRPGPAQADEVLVTSAKP